MMNGRAATAMTAMTTSRPIAITSFFIGESVLREAQTIRTRRPGNRILLILERVELLECCLRVGSFPSMLARRLLFATQQVMKMSFYCRPLGSDDAINAGVAQSAVRGELVATQDAVELRSQSLNGAAARVVK